jgi:hypothetical protein
LLEQYRIELLYLKKRGRESDDTRAIGWRMWEKKPIRSHPN